MDPISQPSPSAIPPVVAGAIATPAPVWPRVCGIIAIVFGSLGVLQGLLGFLKLLVMPLIMDALPAQAAQGARIADAHETELWASTTLTLIAGAILLWGGVLLAHRQRRAVRVLTLWSILKMLIACFAAWVQFHVARDATAEQLRLMQNASAPAWLGNAMQTFQLVIIILLVAWQCALPVFFLIWFSRDKARRDVADWGTAP